SIDARDSVRILKYGEPYLKQDPKDLLVLERVSRLLTTREDKASNERGLAYSQAFEKGLLEMEKEKPASGRMDAQLRDDLDRGIGGSVTLQEGAKGQLGDLSAGESLAKRALEVYPAAKPARKIAAWLNKQKKFPDPLPPLAVVFLFPATGEPDKARLSFRF